MLTRISSAYTSWTWNESRASRGLIMLKSNSNYISHKKIAVPRYLKHWRSRSRIYKPFSSSLSYHKCPITTRCNASPDQSVDHHRPDFDWRLALILAGCSFEAYNGLEDDGVESFSQISSNGTKTTYVDPKFVQQKLSGLLKITVVNATNLPKSDWLPGSKSDPYCQVSIGASTARTKTIESELNPTWNETLYVFVRDIRQQRLLIRVLDEDLLESDDLLGVGMRGLADLIETTSSPADDADAKNTATAMIMTPTPEQTVTIPLQSGGRGSSVTLKLAFEPFNDVQVLMEAAGGRMGGPVIGSPANSLLQSPWRDIKNELIPVEKAADAAFDPVAFVDSPSSDTQAWLLWNPGAKKATITFRGTEQTKWKDVLTDVSLIPTSMDPEGGDTTSQSNAPGLTKGFDTVITGLIQNRRDIKSVIREAVDVIRGGGVDEEWVHAGFLKAYKTVRADILQLVETLLAGETEQWTLYVTGHSLGGALSTLCAYDLARRTNWPRDVVEKPVIVNYNFGSPRVGNRVFAENFNNAVPNCWRVVNNNDAVALVPRLLGFAHVGGKVQLGADGTAADVERDSVMGVGEGASMTDFAAAVVTNALGPVDEEEVATTAAAGGAIETKEEIATVLEAEMSAMSTLLDGSAVEEHLEPMYLKNLVAAAKDNLSDVV